MAYDSARGVTVLFGGWDGSYKGDTWEWDGTTWTPRSTTGPSPRQAHAMAYDSARGVTVLFGGGLSGTANGDTWEWDGTTWTPRSTTGPSPRRFHEMAYDSARGVTVLFGSFDSFDYSRYKGDTWEWDGTTWTQRSTTGPSPRYAHAMAYDGARGVTVLFGGQDNYFLEGDTWEWHGSTWTPRSTTGPSPRERHAMAYDIARGVTVLFGGRRWNGSFYLQGDTWEWDGTTWTLRSLTGPSSRASHAMAYDSARRVTVLFGGYDGSRKGDTWEFANCAVASGLSIAPGGATDFGSIAVGATADHSFTLRNTGLNPIVGNASTPAPFSEVSGASYNLAPGQTQAVTVRYSPTQPGNNIAYITFTGTGTQQRQLLGSAFATPVNGSVVGTVVEDDGTAAATAGQPIPGAVVSISGVRTISDSEGIFSLPGIVPGTYALTVTHPAGGYLTVTLPDVTIPAGPAPPVLIKLPRQIVPPPPVPGQRNTPVLLVSGFGCTDPPWDMDNDSCSKDYCKFTCDKSTWEAVRIALRGAGFEFPNPTNDPDKDYVGELVWDPNEPTPGAPCEPPTNPPANPPCPLAGEILDGTMGVYWNADRLKTYVTAKVKQFYEKQGYYPASINIVASSMGGLITRAFLKDYRQLEVDPDTTRKLNLRVGKVIMIGTPNAGSAVADKATSYLLPVTWLKCRVPVPPSLEELTTRIGSEFHRNHFPFPSDVQLYLLEGTSTEGDACEKLKSGDGLLRPTQFGVPNDGVVPGTSLLGQYLTGVPGGFAGTTVSHYVLETRYSLQPRIHKKLPIDHLWLKQNTEAVAWIQCVLTSQRPETACATRSLSLAAVAGSENAPATKLIDDLEVVVAPGQSSQRLVPVDSATTLRLLLSSEDAATSATVHDPDGYVIAPNEEHADPWTETYEIAVPTPGEWTVSFSLDPAATASAGVSVFAAGDGPVTLIPTTEDSILNSQNALVSCALYVPGEEPGALVPVTGATVLVDLALPDETTTQLALLDDGLHSDGLADDGIYAAVFTNTAQAGSYRLRYRADGTAGGPLTNDAALPPSDAERPSFVKGGLAFRRVAMGTFGVSSAAARISGNLTDEAVDFDADGFADFLRVQFWVTAQQAGTYLASGLVVDETGGSSIAGSETALELPIGTSTVSLLFDCRKLAAPGTYGPFSLQNLELFERRDDQIAWVDRYREAYALATARIEIPCPPFDGDCDGDLDLGDVAGFQRCFSPGVPAEAECERFDQSGDEGVDLLPAPF